MLRYAFTRNHKAMKPCCSEFRLVVAVLLILLDFSSDFLFLSQLMGQSDLEYGRILVYGSCAALGFPILLNSLYLMKFLKCPEMVDFWFFFKRNTLGCVIVFVLSILNTSMFCLFSSHLLGLSLFNVRIPNRVKYRALAGRFTTAGHNDSKHHWQSQGHYCDYYHFDLCLLNFSASWCDESLLFKPYVTHS